ncbi:NDR1/HIN1-like protein 10 [Quercus suber]|uniref:NDR1/HIN1-like protein 10 n=1 Tax=Quercus suber TaxID=58331 RepID=UPI0032DF1935
MAEKRSQLNNAYYGPSIPPQDQSYQRRGRSRSCYYRLFKCLLKTTVSVILIIFLAYIIAWFILYPRTFKLHVTDAKLTKFNFTTNNNILQYKLDLNISLRNPNKKVTIYFDKIKANALYEGQRFDTESLTELGFKVDRKSTHFLNATFAGQQLIELDAHEISEFNAEKSAGVYSIDLRFYLRIRIGIGDFIAGKYKPKVKCELEVPLSSQGNSSTARFETTRCHVYYLIVLNHHYI